MPPRRRAPVDDRRGAERAGDPAGGTRRPPRPTRRRRSRSRPRRAAADDGGERPARHDPDRQRSRARRRRRRARRSSTSRPCPSVYPGAPVPSARGHDPPRCRARNSPRAPTRSRSSPGRGLLIWGATLARLPRLRGAVRAAAPHGRRGGRRPARRRLGDRRLGALGQRLVPRRSPTTATSTRRTRRRSSRSTRCSCAASAGSSSATTCWRASSSRAAASAAAFVAPLAARRSSYAPRRRRTGPSSTWRSSRPRSSSSPSTASRSTSRSRWRRSCSRRRSRWAWAGLATGLAALARVSGVMLLPALAVLAWRAPNRGGALLRLALRCRCMALWPLYLGAASTTGPFVFLTRAALGLGPPPLGCRAARRRLGRARRRLAKGVLQLVAGGNYFPNPDHSPMYWRRAQPRAARLRRAAGRPRRLRVARARRRLRRLRRSGASRCRSRTRCRARRSSRCPRFALGVFPVFIALGLLGPRARGCTRGCSSA